MIPQPSTRPKLRAKTPQPPRWKKRAVLISFVTINLLLVGAVIGMFAFSPANFTDRRPALIAALFSPTPSDTPTSTRTVTQANTQEPSSTPTDTSTPTEEAVDQTPGTPTNSPTPTTLPDYLITSLSTPDTVERKLHVPILMYHYISVPPADADIYRKDLSIEPETFEEQMDWLDENGYQAVTLYELMVALNTGRRHLPEKPIVLTFDDGYADNYENAFPILQEHDFIGTFFILTDVTDRSDPGYMTWEMLTEMSRAGMDIEVHGREHFDMANRDYDWLLFHLLGPAQTIEANLGYQPRFLSYPSGSYDEAVIDVAREVGYWGAVTTYHGAQQDKASPFELQRIRIPGDWSIATFASIVTDT
jgi:peptidoglycan/xylan/chitin deacetylase (PgdA/CDA1 family)